MKKVYPAKDPQETLYYGFNWTPRNIGSEQIVTVTCTPLAGTAVIDACGVAEIPGARSGQGTVFVLSGGVHGEMTEILLHVETDATPPSIMEQTVYVPIRQK